MKQIFCLLALGAALLSRGGMPMPVDLGVSGDPTTSSDSEWTDTDWVVAGAAIALVGGLVLEFAHCGGISAGPAVPTSTPEPLGEVALGGLLLGYGVCSARRSRR